MPVDEVDQLARSFEKLARKVSAAIDPEIVVYRGDGEVFEGPIVGVDYRFSTTVPTEHQERMLEQVAKELRALDMPVAFVLKGDNALIPFIEIACDIEHHRRMLARFAVMDADERAAIMSMMGVLPSIAEVTRDAAGWAERPE
jgi:hypothetical protein